jgi:hypothetical protein
MAVITGTVVAAGTAVILYQNNSYATHQVTFTTHGNSADIYVGGSNVTPSTNGCVFAKSLIYQLDVPAGERLYCAGNGSDTVKYLTFTDD